MNIIFGIIATIVVFLSGIGGGVLINNIEPVHNTESSQKFGSIGFVGTLPTTLAGSGITSSQVTITVTSLTITQTGQKLAMVDFGTIGYITLEPGVSSRQEFASFTGITQNTNGTAVLSGVVRGLSPIAPYTASTSVQFSHGGGTKLIVSNSPPFLNTFANQQNNANITGHYVFTTLPNVATTTTDAMVIANGTTSLVTYNLLANTSFAGTVDATEVGKGIIELGTALEQASSTISGGSGAATVLQTKYASSSPVVGCAVGYTAIVGAGCVPVAGLDGKINPNYIATSSAYNWSGTHTFNGAVTTNSSTTFNGTTTISAVNYTGQFISILASTSINTSTSPIPVLISTSTGALVISEADVATTTDFLGFATSTNVLNGATGTVQISGIVSGFSGLTAGRSYYVQDTRGTIGTTIGSAELYVGIAYSATQILLDRKDDAWQYLGASGFTSGGAYGAATHADTATVPSNVRYVVVTGNFANNAAATSYLHGTYFKVGATTGSQGSCSGTVGVPGYATVAWSGSTITITETASCAAATVSSSAYTAYFYR